MERPLPLRLQRATRIDCFNGSININSLLVQLFCCSLALLASRLSSWEQRSKKKKFQWGRGEILKNEEVPAPWDPFSFGFYWDDLTVQLVCGGDGDGAKIHRTQELPWWSSG